ncbi:MalY/PatB family protein [Nonomuraea sp. NPDC050556]|uniref:MalY/PatB family protein n=1 Tax=Nonomuraea sp. NPDC050556 TaxID=3364369 RepID=UPI00378AE8AB
MDYPVAPVIREALEKRIVTDLGYPMWDEQSSPPPLVEAFAHRMETRYRWRPDPSHARAFTDLNQALQVLLHHLTEPGEPIALHTPAYVAFVATLAEMNRPILPIPMLPDGDSWRFELPDVTGCHILLLVNPHNPTGRAFTRAELTEIADLAERHDLLVISDEIHADLTFAPHEHIPFATLLPDRTITLTSASKAFNLGGVRCAVAHIGPAHVRKQLSDMPGMLYGEANVFGVEATIAAWTHGGPWLAETMKTLDANRHTLADRLPKTIGYRLPEATYLAWLDFGHPDAAEKVEQRAKVLLSPGKSFGPGGDHYARLNFATHPEILEEILDRLSAVAE